MDTVTHAVTGLALGAVAQTVSGVGNGEVASALMWTTVVASQAPDFDGLIRLVAGKNAYLKYHRTYTHTVPIMALIAIMIVLAIKLIFPAAPAGAVFLWAFISMVMHVVMDLTTSYGTMALWPSKKTMVAWDWVLIVDPVMLLLLSGGVLVWYVGGLPALPLFGAVFGGIGLYVLIRALIHRRLMQYVQSQYPHAKSVSVLPTVELSSWCFVVEEHPVGTSQQLLTGFVYYPCQRLVVEQKYYNHYSPAVEAALQSTVGQVFKKFVRHLAFWHQHTPDGVLIIMVDLRYKYWNRYPFAAYVWLDNNLKVCKEDLSQSNEKMMKAALRQNIEGGRV